MLIIIFSIKKASLVHFQTRPNHDMMALVKDGEEVERGNDRNAFKAHLYDPYLWDQGILLWLSSHHSRWLRQNLEQNPGTARGPQGPTDHPGPCLQLVGAQHATAGAT